MLKRVKALIYASALLLTLKIGLDNYESFSGPRWASMRTAEPQDVIVRNLLDSTFYTPTPGADLVDQLQTAVGPYSMTLLSVPRSGRPFEMAVQCEASIVGKWACPPMYYLHFRGPVAYTVPPRYDAFRHNTTTGRTIISITLNHPGIYELWAYPEWPIPGECPPERGGWGPETPPVPAIAGSGKTIITVVEHVPPPPHHTRPCVHEDYRTAMESEWVSLSHIQEEYRGKEWLEGHYNRSNSLHPHGEMPDYVYLPLQCKRPALDFRALAEANKALKHVLYLGDSILRSHYCGHLWPTLFEDSEYNEPQKTLCDYTDNIPVYHFGDRSFVYNRKSPESQTDTSNSSSQILFSQRFVGDDLQAARRHLEAIATQDPPVTHLVTNIGMWFGVPSPEQYAQTVHDFLHIITEILGIDIHITWLHTASTVPAVNCWHFMKRERLRHHSSYANTVIDEIRDSYPGLKLRALDAFPILDSRPETASDGRHYVREGPLPNIKRRPMVGRADDAVHDLMWSAWLEDYRESERDLLSK